MNPRLRRVLLIGLVGMSAIFASPAQTRPAEAVRIERLASLCRLWNSVKFFHPFLAYKDLDWDAALLRAIPKVNATESTQDYSAVIQGMLDALGDPATHVVVTSPVGSPSNGERDPTWKWTEDKIVIVTIRNYADLADFQGASDKLEAVQKEIGKARAVLFDLRSAAPLRADQWGLLSDEFAWSGIQKSLSSSTLSTPGQRLRMHVGFAPQDGSPSGGYHSAFSVRDGQRLSGGPDTQDRPIAFLINAWSELPPIALALQGVGKGFIVAEGKANDASVVRTHRIRLAEEIEAQVRLGELVYEDGTSGLHVDSEVPPDGKNGDRAQEVGLDLLRHPRARVQNRNLLVPRAVPPPEKAYREMKYPPPEYRVLAAFRIWGVIHYFFPYKDLMGEDWDAVLKRFIPRMEAARDAREYALTVAEMVTHLHDSHVRATGGALSEYFGVAAPPILMQMIEGVPIVVQFLPAKAAGAVSTGDEILEIDGEDARARFERYVKYTPASTPQGLIRSVQLRFLNGPEGSTIRLTLRDAANRKKSIGLPRKAEFLPAFEGWRSGEVLRILPGNIGYADLDRLTVPMVDAMFEKFKETRAIIFDVRGYPSGTVWSIAPRLTERNSVPAARFERAVLLEPEDEGGDRGLPVTIDSFVQRLPPTSGWRYKGQTVMLIDERTISHAEHTGLFLEAANGTKFIGSPTTGANGDVTSFVLPGGIRITFTGQGVRHADGRQLQRIGLVPSVEVRPTVAGIRAGRDEVLERAIQFIQDGSSELAK